MKQGGSIVTFAQERATGRVPTLGVVGAALWIAWITLIYSTDATFPAAFDVQAATANAFVLSTAALGVALIALSFFPRWTQEHLLRGRPLAAASCIGALATLVVLNAAAVPAPLFMASAVATGCVTSLIALKAATVFSEVETKAMIVGMGCALILGVLVYAFDTMLLLCGLHSPAAVILVLLLPLAVFALTFDGAASEGSDGAGGGSLAVTPALGRLIAFVVILLFLLSLTRGYYPNLIDGSQFATSRCVVAIGLVIVSLAAIATAWLCPRDAAFGLLSYGALLLSVLAVLVLALLNVGPTLMGDVSSVLFGLTMLCLWILLCRVSFRSGMESVQVVGVGFGAACLGTTAGVGTGALLYNEGMVPISLTLVMAVAVVLCVAASLFLLRLNDVRALMEPEPGAVGEEAPASAADARGSLGLADDGAALAPSALDDYQATLQRLCGIMALDFGLSTREADVLELLVVGKDAKAIADELFISFNTVRSHIRRIYVKLDVHSRQELLDRVRSQRSLS